MMQGETRPYLYILDDADEPLPCDEMRWYAWWSLARATNREVIGATRVAPDGMGTEQLSRASDEGICVSTVFLGRDINRWSWEPPLLYETLVFIDGQILHASQCHYPTRAAALLGHQGMVNIVVAAARASYPESSSGESGIRATMTPAVICEPRERGLKAEMAANMTEEIFERLKWGASSAEELAAATTWHPRLIEISLEALRLHGLIEIEGADEPVVVPVLTADAIVAGNRGPRYRVTEMRRR